MKKTIFCAADNWQGRYSSCVAVADNIDGPYHNGQERVPYAGGTIFLKTTKGIDGVPF